MVDELTDEALGRITFVEVTDHSLPDTPAEVRAARREQMGTAYDATGPAEQLAYIRAGKGIAAAVRAEQRAAGMTAATIPVTKPRSRSAPPSSGSSPDNVLAESGKGANRMNERALLIEQIRGAMALMNTTPNPPASTKVFAFLSVLHPEIPLAKRLRLAREIAEVCDG